ncbi:FAD-binding protein [Bacillus carboniphilus]|uniref:FAD-binding protein n=1 Tax=Bacillus carboniphilus TaxID=86663 RepID=A0ABY9JRK2_9BACI|nr:FAD-binding protein [Bacillus carboniphilus]WLR41363.1 FAD-binding protein [Bacillus carboniphilus]
MLSIESEKNTKQWMNWSEQVKFTPEHILYPGTIEEVQTIVKECVLKEKKIRVIGSGHSFSPLIETKQTLISLDHLQGVGQIDTGENTIEVLAGTKLYRLGELLHELGYAMENMGDIDQQSIAGAISTGTHGTGVPLKILLHK